MEDKLILLEREALDAIKQINDDEKLREFELKYLGRKGLITELLRDVSSIPKEERPRFWMLSNQIKNNIQKEIEAKRESIMNKYYSSIWETEWRDVGQDSLCNSWIWHRHPISKLIDEIIYVFSRMGFSLACWDEIESEWFNFTALNLWADHPAREMHDTFFVKDLIAPKLSNMEDERDRGYVLRTQTSDVQIHYMLENKPPFAVIAPWKTYRKDSDATHSPMFHQCEWLYIDRNVSLSNLKYVLETALREILWDNNLELRFRLSYFPFVEPWMEFDVTCPICQWKDNRCKVCKWNNWLEISWCWMVHPKVLRNGWINPNEFNWFAFWLWIDRLAMIKHRINDIRLLYENDLRFLEQF